MLCNMETPLVSIIVITYNSAKYVLETLESAKAQTYQNIELIISDDGSQDETVELCENWLAENKDRFIDSQIITVEKNTGIPANCNRGVKASHGEWIKLIAGDDAFYNGAITNTISFLVKNPQIEVLQTSIQFFNENFEERSIMEIMQPQQFQWSFFSSRAEKQHFDLQITNPVAAPGIFFKRIILEEMNFFDEEIIICEDYPMWLKLTNAGIRIYFENILTVKYRRHLESVTLGSHVGVHFCTVQNANFQLDISSKYFRSGINKFKHRIKYKLYKILNKEIFVNSLSEKSLIFLSKVIWKLFT